MTTYNLIGDNQPMTVTG